MVTSWSPILHRQVADDPPEFLGKHAERSWVESGCKNDQLFSAPTCDEVARPQMCDEPLRDRAEYEVAAGVVVAAVDPVEAIEVEQEQRGGVASARDARVLGCGCLLEAPSVEQARQRVSTRESPFGCQLSEEPNPADAREGEDRQQRAEPEQRQHRVRGELVDQDDDQRKRHRQLDRQRDELAANHSFRLWEAADMLDERHPSERESRGGAHGEQRP